jgi:heat shock protein HtpX
MAKWSHKIQPLKANSSNPQEAWLVKTVHQYARMSNIKTMPEVGVYNSNDLNAFATGPTKNKSLVAVSTGLLHNMSKDEVEGVLAHEIAHIKNGDMVTMVLLQGTINTLVMFAARILSDIVASRLSRDGERGSFWVRMILYQVFAMALGVLGMVVQGTFSRHREFRADAGGARLAGPDKMVKSLQKLQSFYNPQQQKAQKQEPIAALQISGYFRKSSLAQLMSTHPPLDKRIAALKKRQL